MRFLYKKRNYLPILMMTLLLAACGGKNKAEETTVSINAKGVVTEEIVGSRDKQNYSSEELQSFADKEIKAYNQKAKGEQVNLESCEINKGVPRLKITYDSCSDYAAYHNTVFFYGTISEAKSSGFDFNADFVDNNGDTAASATILANDADWHVLILDEPVRVKVNGNIIYASKNTKIINSREARPTGKTDSSDNNITTASLVYLIFK